MINGKSGMVIKAASSPKNPACVVGIAEGFSRISLNCLHDCPVIVVNHTADIAKKIFAFVVFFMISIWKLLQFKK